MADGRSRRKPAAMEVAGGDERSAKDENVDDSAMAVDLDVNVEAEVSKLRGRWELASVLNFLNVFEPFIGKSLRISAEEIEMGLIKPDSLLAELHITLLKGIPPGSKMLSGSDAWVTVLCKKLAMWWPWVAEGEMPIKASKGEEISNYKKLDPMSRLMILKALCEIRADQDDAVSYISDCLKDGSQMSSFRKDRFGGDGNGTTYWYDGSPFVGYRLYREVIKCEMKIKGKSKGSSTLPMFSSHWETMATNLEEFHKVQDNLLCSKIISEVAVGRIIGSDAIPVLEKLQKNKERSLKRRQRQETLLNDFKNSCIVGVTRTCRIRTPVSYTFEAYDRAISDAIRHSKNVTSADKQEQGMHNKQGRKDAISTGRDPDTSMKSDEDDDSGKNNERSDDDSGKSNESNDDESGKSNDSNDDDTDSSSLKDVSVDNVDADDKDYEDKDDSDENENDDNRDENENDDNCDSDYSDAKGNKEMLHSQKQTVSNLNESMGVRSKRLDKSSNYPSSVNRNLGAKNRLRQRPTLNYAFDSVVVPDSDEEN